MAERTILAKHLQFIGQESRIIKIELPQVL